MIIKYLISFIIFKIIHYLPAGKLCNILNFRLVIFLGSNHIRRLRNLKKLVSKFETIDYTLKIIKYPSRYSADDMLKEKTLKYYIFNLIAKFFYFMVPTYIWILRKPNNT